MITDKIYKVSVLLDSKGFENKIQEISVKETNKSFVGEGCRIAKDKLMKIDTIYIETHRFLRYFTYCKDGQQQEAFDMLKQYIVNKAREYKKEIDILYSHIN
jgi:hypothetical protein